MISTPTEWARQECFKYILFRIRCHMHDFYSAFIAEQQTVLRYGWHGIVCTGRVGRCTLSGLVTHSLSPFICSVSPPISFKEPAESSSSSGASSSDSSTPSSTQLFNPWWFWTIKASGRDENLREISSVVASPTKGRLATIKPAASEENDSNLFHKQA
mmetsp:Transcript_18533/g.36273  ORF Transcript_18533/g.36273 Transcript_18533/m.36273 type:complete len:158 (+) Transcript_18533:763-1236(+)